MPCATPQNASGCTDRRRGSAFLVRDGFFHHTTDMRAFKEIVAAREEFFVARLPTSTIVEVNHLADPGLMIEFQATAAL